MPGTNRKMPKKMRGGGGATAKPKKAPVKKMRGGGAFAMNKGGAAVRSSCPSKDL